MIDTDRSTVTASGYVPGQTCTTSPSLAADIAAEMLVNGAPAHPTTSVRGDAALAVAETDIVKVAAHARKLKVQATRLIRGIKPSRGDIAGPASRS
jgi:hypothetical protein